MNRSPRMLLHGAVAGILAATALAIWFLVIDRVSGVPMHTPAFLAGALLGMQNAQPATGTIVAYTIFHYAVFIALGILFAWLIGNVPTFRGVLFGAIVGFLLFDLLFYAGLVISGTNIIRALGWPRVLVGNIVAGIVMIGYLGAVLPSEGRGWLPALREHRTAREGLIAGLLGAAAVAVWFLVLDAAGRRLLFTPAALGSALFFGATSPAQVTVDFATVAGYTLIHVAAFVLVGLVAAAVVRGSEDSPPLVLGLALLLAVAETFFIGLVAIAASWILGTVAWWTIAVGNVLAVLAMGAYLLQAHPRMRHTLREPLERPA